MRTVFHCRFVCSVSSQVGLGALPLAVDAVNADPTLLPGKKLNFVAADIGTNPR